MCFARLHFFEPTSLRQLPRAPRVFNSQTRISWSRGFQRFVAKEFLPPKELRKMQFYSSCVDNCCTTYGMMVFYKGAEARLPYLAEPSDVSFKATKCETNANPPNLSEIQPKRNYPKSNNTRAGTTSAHVLFMLFFRFFTLVSPTKRVVFSKLPNSKPAFHCE